MKTDMGEQKSNPSTPQPEKKAQHYYFTTEWRLGIREVRLSRRATPDIFSVKSYMWHFKNPIIHLQVLRRGVPEGTVNCKYRSLQSLLEFLRLGFRVSSN